MTATKRMPAAERHAQLVDVAEQLFIERGYAAVSMEDIARAAGVSRPIVYGHFGSREGAYLACVERARATYEERLLGKVHPEDPPREQLHTGFDAFFSMLEEDPGRWELLFGSNAVLPGAATQELAQLRFGTIEQIRLLLAASSAPGVPADRIEAAAHAVSGIGERLGHWWRTRPDIPRAEIVVHATDMAWAGIQRYARTS